MPYNTSFERLRTILADLRERCPWDRKQTIQTLRPLSIEETYELADAIDREDWGGLREELGDILLHIVFYARLGTEAGQFTLEDVIAGVCDKLVARHPHIYGAVTVRNDDDVKRNWEALKLKEGKKGILAGVPAAQPALPKATRLQEKARQAGFDWDRAEDVRAKVTEELNELDEAVAGGDTARMQDELGDLLFSIVNYARFLDLDPETALEGTNRKFRRRFERMETLAAEAGTPLPGPALPELDRLWNAAKEEER